MTSANRRYLAGLWLRTSLAGLLLLIAYPWPAAEAGIVDRIKDIYGMPEQVQQLEEQYGKAKEALDQNRAKLEETLKRSEEAEQRFLKAQDRLLDENRQLRERNDRLEQVIGQLETARQEQVGRSRQLLWTGVTAGLLVVLYFVLTRVVRVAIWRRERRGRQGGFK